MAKVKPVKEDTKKALRNPKNGSVAKNKTPKFKNTPTSKVALLDSKNGKPASKKNGVNNKKNVLTGKGKNAKNSAKSKKDEEEDDSDSDINEGISIAEEVSIQGEDDDAESSDESFSPNLLGASLADETDESDEEFEGEETEENRGIKMFKGTKRGNKNCKDNEEDEEDEDDSSEEDEEDSEEEEEPALGLSVLLGDSLKDESGDDDFESCDEDEDDDDDEDVSENDSVDQSLNSTHVTSSGDDSDENDDDDDDEEDDDDDSPGLSDLMGNLDDDSDDDDFEGDEEDEDDEDEDISDEEGSDEAASPQKKLKKEKSEKRNLSADEMKTREEQQPRTIFVGNVPKETQLSRLRNEFKKFGAIHSIRIRGVVPDDPNLPLKVAAIKKRIHPKIKTVCVFIVFENEDSVEKALSMNGKKFDGNYLRVDRAIKNSNVNKKKSIFLGNLPFTIEDNDLWEAFKDCGRIESVRICRNKVTGVGLGYGFINFETTDGPVLALRLNGTKIQNREVRVKTFVPDSPKTKKDKNNKKRQRSDDNEGSSPKKMKTEFESPRGNKKFKKRSQGEKQRGKSESTSPQNKNQVNFQGQTADAKKKSKQNKSLKKKKEMAAKLLAKPKKPAAN